MKMVCRAVLWVVFICGFTAQASIQMGVVGYENSNTICEITGTGGYFDLYLQCLGTNTSVSATDDSVRVTDLGITPQQNRLFQIEGRGDSLFSIHPSWSSLFVVEMFNLSMSKIGVYTNSLDRYFRADAGMAYTIVLGQSVMLDATQSYLVQYGWNPSASLQSPNAMIVEWKIDGISVGPLVSFDELVGTLDLGYGTHSLQLNATAFDEYGFIYEGSAFSTIEIIPEPPTMLLISLGGLILLKRVNLRGQEHFKLTRQHVCLKPGTVEQPTRPQSYG